MDDVVGDVVVVPALPPATVVEVDAVAGATVDEVDEVDVDDVVVVAL